MRACVRDNPYCFLMHVSTAISADNQLDPACVLYCAMDVQCCVCMYICTYVHDVCRRTVLVRTQIYTVFGRILMYDVRCTFVEHFFLGLCLPHVQYAFCIICSSTES